MSNAFHFVFFNKLYYKVSFTLIQHTRGFTLRCLSFNTGFEDGAKYFHAE